MDNPFGRAILYTYNSAGRLISCMDKGGTVHVMNYDGTGKPTGVVPLADAAVRLPADAATVRRFVHTFEFRLSGSEEMTKSVPLADSGSFRLVFDGTITGMRKRGPGAAVPAIIAHSKYEVHP